MTGAGRNHDPFKVIDELNERLRLVTNELRHAERELDETHRYKTALKHIEAVASAALNHHRRAPPPAA